MSEAPRHRDRTDGDDGAGLVATVVTYDDSPDECTIYPADANDADIVTRWISAAEGSFVALADSR
jgi:hypothetical protein